MSTPLYTHIFASIGNVDIQRRLLCCCKKYVTLQMTQCWCPFAEFAVSKVCKSSVPAKNKQLIMSTLITIPQVKLILSLWAIRTDLSWNKLWERQLLFLSHKLTLEWISFFFCFFLKAVFHDPISVSHKQLKVWEDRWGHNCRLVAGN